MSANKDIAEIKATIAALSAVVLKLAEGAPGVTPSAAAPVAQKGEAKVYDAPKWSIYKGDHAPVIRMENVGIGQGGRPGLTVGNAVIRTVDFFMANPKEWQKAKAALAEARK